MFNLVSQLSSGKIVYVDIGVYTCLYANGVAARERNSLYTVCVVANHATYLSSLVMGVIDLARKISANQEWSLMVLREDVDL